MKINELEQSQFNTPNVTMDTSKLYFQYGEREIYDILRHYIDNPGFFGDLINDKTGHNVSWDDRDNAYYNFMYILINTLSEAQKSYLLDVALDEPNYYAAEVFLKNPQIKITPEQFEKAYNGDTKEQKSLQLKKAVVSNPSIPLTSEHLHDGLLNEDYFLKPAYAKRHDKNISQETLDAIFSDDMHEIVAVQLLKNPYINFSSQHIESALNSENFEIRLLMARNYHLPFTPAQIEKGLQDEGFEYDIYDDSYNEYSPNDVKKAFIKNPNIVLPAEQLKELMLKDEYLASAALSRSDIVLDDKAINHILKMKNRTTVALLENKNIYLNDQQLLSFLYSDQYAPDFLAKFYLSREDVPLSELVKGVLSVFPNKEIQEALKVKQEKNTVNKPGNN